MVTRKNDYFKQQFFLEKIDANKLSAVISCHDAMLHTTDWWEDQDIFTEQGGKICNEKTHLEMILKTAEEHKKGEYYLRTGYGSKSHYGRVYPHKMASLGMMRRPIRHFLAEDIYYDLDMVNAHFSLALGICNKLHYKRTKKIKKYVNTRDETLKKYMDMYGLSRDKAKSMFIIMLNGGEITYFLEKNAKKTYTPDSYLKGFQRECAGVCDRFIDEVDTELFDELTMTKVIMAEKRRTFISKYLQIEEERILQYLFDLAQKKQLVMWGESRCILCHDGAMIEKSLFQERNVDINKFILELNKVVIQETGYNVKFKIKEFDEGYKIRDILKKNDIDWTIPYVDSWKAKYNITRSQVITDDDLALARLFYDTKVNDYVFCLKNLYKKNDCGMYKITHKSSLIQDYINHIEEFDKEYGKRDWDMSPNMRNEKFIFFKELLLAAQKTYFVTVDTKKFKKELESASGMLKLHQDKIRTKIRNCNGRNNIGTDLITLYSDDSFTEKLDTDENLLGFNNGVLDIDSGIWEVRNTRDNEYVSMSCLYDFYIDDQVIKDKKKIYDIINSMFENPEKTDFLLKVIAKCLKGGNNKEEFALFLIGDGGNGKGVIDRIVMAALGEYHYPLSYKTFTHLKADNRSVELYDSRNRRYNSISEPPKAFAFDPDTFKIWTGKDSINVRNNYDNKMTQITPNTSVLQSNHPIEFTSDTQNNSMLRRIVAAHLPYQFMPVGEVDKNNPIHKPRIPNLKEDIMKKDSLKRGIMLLLLEYYKKYKEEGLEKPPSIIVDTQNYTSKLSPDRDWFDSNLKICEKDGKNIVISAILEKYREETKSNWKLKHFKSKLQEYGFILKKGRGYTLDGSTRVGGNSRQVVENVVYLGYDEESDEEEE